jgi:hypothetical protein
MLRFLNVMPKAPVFTFLLLCSFMPGHLFADVIELNLSGVITYSRFSSVNIGDSFTASVFYNSTGSPDSSIACSYPVECFASYALPLATVINVDGSSITSSVSDPLGENSIQVDDYYPASDADDSITWMSVFYTLDTTGPLSAEQLSYDYLTIEFLGPNTVLNAPTPMVPGNFPSLDQWSTSEISFATLNSSLGGAFFTGDVTSLTESVVSPEPSQTPFVVAASLCLTWAFRRKRRP